MALAWILGIVGAVGVTGAIVLAIVAPALLPVVFRAIAGIFSAILSTRIGCAAIALIGGLVAGNIYGDFHGRAIERQKCEAAELRADQAAIDRDRLQGELAERDTDTKAAELETELAAEREKVREYQRSLLTREGGACPLTGDDLRGLRHDPGRARSNPKAGRKAPARNRTLKRGSGA